MALKLVLFGMVNAASISKPERFVTAVDVFDVLAQQCHQGKLVLTDILIMLTFLARKARALPLFLW